MTEFDSGAKSSERKPRYDLVSKALLERWAQRMTEGATSHGERNYLRGAADTQFITDRRNHLFEHVLRYLDGDTSTDHAAAVIANLQILEDCRQSADATGEP